MQRRGKVTSQLLLMNNSLTQYERQDRFSCQHCGLLLFDLNLLLLSSSLYYDASTATVNEIKWATGGLRAAGLMGGLYVEPVCFG